MIGDNYLGRFLNGVSHVDLNFIKLPPHFDGVNEPANADYEALLPGFGTLPPCFQGVIKFAYFFIRTSYVVTFPLRIQ